MENNGGIISVDDIRDLYMEVMLNGVGQGGGHHSSPEFSMGNGGVADNLNFICQELTEESTGDKRYSGVDRGNH